MGEERQAIAHSPMNSTHHRPLVEISRPHVTPLPSACLLSSHESCRSCLRTSRLISVCHINTCFIEHRSLSHCDRSCERYAMHDGICIIEFLRAMRDPPLRRAHRVALPHWILVRRHRLRACSEKEGERAEEEPGMSHTSIVREEYEENYKPQIIFVQRTLE